MLIVSSPWVQPRPVQKARESQLCSSPMNSAVNYKLQIRSNTSNQNICLFINIKFSKSLINFLDTVKKHSSVREWEKERRREETFLLSERKISRNNSLLGHQMMTKIFASKSLEGNSSSETLVLVLPYFHSFSNWYGISFHRNCYFGTSLIAVRAAASVYLQSSAVIYTHIKQYCTVVTPILHTIPQILFFYTKLGWMSGSC